MSPSELKRHVATLARVLPLINEEQADNARYIARHAEDFDGLSTWLHEEGGYGDAVWSEVDAVVYAAEAIAQKNGLGKMALEMRNARRAIEAINEEFALRLATPRNAVRPPARPSLVVYRGERLSGQQPTLVASPDLRVVASFAVVAANRTDTVPAPAGKRAV